MKRTLIVILVASAFGGMPAHAADPANGKRLAERWCASCHLVAPDQARASPDAGAFASMGKEPGFDAGRLALFLLAPHPPMPSMALTRSEAADIASYIQSLARPN